jgi:hypothetical protein
VRRDKACVGADGEEWRWTNQPAGHKTAILMQARQRRRSSVVVDEGSLNAGDLSAGQTASSANVAPTATSGKRTPIFRRGPRVVRVRLRSGEQASCGAHGSVVVLRAVPEKQSTPADDVNESYSVNGAR